jgi:hypothetical protein
MDLLLRTFFAELFIIISNQVSQSEIIIFWSKLATVFTLCAKKVVFWNYEERIEAHL